MEPDAPGTAAWAASIASGRSDDCHAFNFVASDSEDGQPIIEGRILERLLHKLDQMQAALDDRVFDVIGEVLSLNDVNLPEMLREAAVRTAAARRLSRPDRPHRSQPPETIRRGHRASRLRAANVDFSGFQMRMLEAEERRLMPQVCRGAVHQRGAGDRPQGSRRGPTAFGASSMFSPICAPSGSRAFDGSASPSRVSQAHVSTRNTWTGAHTSTLSCLVPAIALYAALTRS